VQCHCRISHACEDFMHIGYEIIPAKLFGSPRIAFNRSKLMFNIEQARKAGQKEVEDYLNHMLSELEENGQW